MRGLPKTRRFLEDLPPMTKAELIAVLPSCPTKQKLVEPCPGDREWRGPERELYGLESRSCHGQPEHPSFALIRPVFRRTRFAQGVPDQELRTFPEPGFVRSSAMLMYAAEP
jgi:hypothetical protein